MLGPWAGAVVIAAVLIVQCFLFGDGGFTALGANFVNMGLIGSVGGYAIYAPVRRLIGGRRGVLIGAMVAAWFTVLLAAGACAIELSASGRRADFFRVLSWLALVHAVIGIGEAIITGLVIRFVLITRPDLIELGPGQSQGPEAATAEESGGALAADRARRAGRGAGRGGLSLAVRLRIPRRPGVRRPEARVPDGSAVVLASPRPHARLPASASQPGARESRDGRRRPGRHARGLRLELEPGAGVRRHGWASRTGKGDGGCGLTPPTCRAAADRFLRRVDARVKLLFVLGFVVAAVATPVGQWQVLGGLGLVLAFLIGLSGCSLRSLLLRWAGFLVLVGFLAVMIAPGLPDRSGHGVAAVIVTILAKNSLAFLAMLVLAAVTPWHLLVRAMHKLGLPRVLVATLLFMERYVHVLADELGRMSIARRARTFRRGNILSWSTAHEPDRDALPALFRACGSSPRRHDRPGMGWDAADAGRLKRRCPGGIMVVSRWIPLPSWILRPCRSADA